MTGESYTSLIDGNPITVAEDRLDIQSSATSVTLAAGCGNIQRVTFTASGQSLILPPATTYSVGHEFIVHNVGAETFAVKTTGSATTLGTAATGSMYYVYLYAKATAEGSWGFQAMAGGGAEAGANSNITSLTGLTTPLSVGQGGTGLDADTTGAATHFVRQASTGAAFTVGAIVAADLPVMVGDSGSGGTKGAVPAPAAGDAAAGKVLKADGSWVAQTAGVDAATAFVTIGNDAALSAERALTAGTGITITDGGAGTTVTLDVTRPVPDFSSNTLKYMRVNSGETALEYRTPTQVWTDVGAIALATANTWTAAQEISLSGSAAEQLTLTSTSADSSSGPVLRLYRNSASPADSDTMGRIYFAGRDGSGVRLYGSIVSSIVTVAAPDGALAFQVYRAATGLQSRLIAGAGIYTPNATGTDKGVDTINASAVYDDNVLLTDYVFDAALDGEIDLAKYGHVPAASFDLAWLDIDEFTAYWRRERALPGIPNQETWTEETRPSVGYMAQRLHEICEVQAVHIAALHERLSALEARCGG